MEIEYDAKHDLMNIQFLKNRKIVESVETEDGLIIDYGKGRKIVSIEILDASKRIDAHPHGKFHFTLVSPEVPA